MYIKIYILSVFYISPWTLTLCNICTNCLNKLNENCFLIAVLKYSLYKITCADQFTLEKCWVFLQGILYTRIASIARDPKNSRNTILKINQYKQNLIHKRSTWAVANLSSVELNYTRPLFKHIYISNILFSLSTVFKTTSINALYIY